MIINLFVNKNIYFEFPTILTSNFQPKTTKGSKEKVSNLYECSKPIFQARQYIVVWLKYKEKQKTERLLPDLVL